MPPFILWTRVGSPENEWTAWRPKTSFSSIKMGDFPANVMIPLTGPMLRTLWEDGTHMRTKGIPGIRIPVGIADPRATWAHWRFPDPRYLYVMDSVPALCGEKWWKSSYCPTVNFSRSSWIVHQDLGIPKINRKSHKSCANRPLNFPSKSIFCKRLPSGKPT